MSKKKNKKQGFLGWGGWDPSKEAKPHFNPGVEKVIATKIDSAYERRLKTGDVDNMAEYNEAVAKGYDKLWDDTQKADAEFGRRSDVSASEPTPSYYISKNGKLIPVYEGGEEDEVGQSNFYGRDYYDRFNFGNQRLGQGNQHSGTSHLSDKERERLGRYKDGGLIDSYDSYSYGMDEYRKSGVWGGYSAYRAPTLSYRYIEQMANVLAAHYGITIIMGDEWEVDIAKKTLTYNPLSLTSGTKADLLLTLLHEIGHIINTTPNDKLKAEPTSSFQWADPIGKTLFEIPAVFEDVRNDHIMRTTYSGADEIYESAQEAPVRALALKLIKYGAAVRDYWKQEEARFLQEVQSTMLTMQQEMKVNPAQEAKIKKSIVNTMMDAFQTSPQEDLKTVATRASEEITMSNEEREKKSEIPNAFDYAGLMLLKAYGYEPKSKHEKEFYDQVEPYLAATEESLPKFKTLKKTQQLFDLMESEVTPKIQELIDRVQFPPTLKDKVSAKTAAQMRANMARAMQGRPETAQAGKQKTRTGGSGPGNVMPKDWAEGDYASLRDSVKSETNRLVRFLMNIRREEQAVRMTRHERRGKLDSRSLYKFANGSQRLFKRKLANIDTVRSFAFSLVVDTSGSMNGDRIINSVRAMIALAEAFERVGIPYEIVEFESQAMIIKQFDTERLDKKTKSSIGGLVKSSGGGTNIDQAFKTTKILQRPERNKVMVLITDGGVGDPRYIKRTYVDEFKKKGVQSFGFALDGYPEEIRAMCEEGKGFNIPTPAKMIPAFEDLVRKLIRSARSEMMRVNN